MVTCLGRGLQTPVGLYLDSVTNWDNDFERVAQPIARGCFGCSADTPPPRNKVVNFYHASTCTGIQNAMSVYHFRLSVRPSVT